MCAHICYWQAPAIILLKNEKDRKLSLKKNREERVCTALSIDIRLFSNAHFKQRVKGKFSSLNFLPPSLYCLNSHILFICNTTYHHSRCPNKTLALHYSAGTLSHTQIHTHSFNHSVNSCTTEST